MKYCPNCGTPNKDDAQFCANCGAPISNTSAGEHLSRTGAAQNEQSTNTNVNQFAPQPPKKSHGWLIALLVIVIIVLVVVIGGVIGSQSKKSNAKAEQSAKTEVSQKQKATTNNDDSNLSADNLTPQQTATAIAYYQGTNSLAWSAVSTDQMSHDVYVQKNGDENISNKGAGVSYWFGAVGNGYSEYTLSNNGKTVNIYQIDSGSDSVQDPKESVSLQTIVDTVNSKHVAQKVRDVANGVHVKDYRSDSDNHDNDSNNNNVDTTKLNKDQVKDWALRTFKHDYSDSADDDLSTEYLGVDDDNYAEVEVHDHDDSDMDTTYRVNGSGELQEKTGDSWTTVSDSY
ncbi:MAG TPA: zinc-ribbon domain-containing protein [Candidatus Ligilactobacillus excrementigallinarum]|uniref:Zinc-ribbon domain-containing protein n=1 Tax=Candidatus Ligilactobacillus excrementigallinarum TaxID=2838641 RepID=A0A9D1UWC6_9LACO|nr:zinc-ribbon domain-containing protein [Candidatus Ligilactobacillus excrementigallinarum]